MATRGKKSKKMDMTESAAAVESDDEGKADPEAGVPADEEAEPRLVLDVEDTNPVKVLRRDRTGEMTRGKSKTGSTTG